MPEILTIAIPTFNRSSCLERQLTNLCAQYDGRIKIIISDNGSIDNTREVVEAFQKRLPNLLYSRNSQNVGFDRNLLKLYGMACSEYIWFLSDDDIICQGSIEKVLALISQHLPTVMILGSRLGEEERTNDVTDESCSVKIIDRLEMVNDYRLFTKMIFISGLVVRKLPDISISELSRLTGSLFFHVSLSMVLLSKIFCVCVAQGTVVVTREVGYVTNTEIAFIWFVGPAIAMHLPQYGYDTRKVRQCINKSRWSFFMLVIASKLGMYRINPNLSIGTVDQIRILLGKKTLIFVRMCLKLNKIIPSSLLKLIYFLRCIFRFGVKGGIEIFQSKTSQANSEKTSGC